MWKNPHKPSFGNLDGVKVLYAAASVAGPHAAQLLADFGADVIWLENAKSPDVMRALQPRRTVYSERRNQRNISLDMKAAGGKKVFEALLKEADIFLEASKGGQYTRMGYPDEKMWELNPSLVIVHVSGFGQTGLPEYVSRPSYDGVSQAFAGYTWRNRNNETAPYPVGPYAADYITSVYAALGATAALYRAKATGKGESVDVAQYEAVLRSQGGPEDWFTDHRLAPAAGAPDPAAGCARYLCKDGAYIHCSFLGAGIYKKIIPLVGLEYGSEMYPEGIAFIRRDGNPDGPAATLDTAIAKFCLDRTASEAEEIFLKNGLSACKINTYEDLENNPQVKAREMILESVAYDGRVIRSAGFCPKFTNNPSMNWRTGASQGMDNDEILAELGFSADDVTALYEEGAIVKK